MIRVVLLFGLCLSVLVGIVRGDSPFPAHRVAGNTYYVGSHELASYLITTPDGHFLINSSFEETVPLIRGAVESLGFKMTDRSKDLGDFMRVPGRTDHHSLFLLHRANQTRFDHVAFEVHDFDELMTGGHHLTNRGWKAVTRPGRHMVGSNLFWYFQNPCGGKTEYFSDIDIMDDNWVPQTHEKHPGWAIWEFDPQ